MYVLTFDEKLYLYFYSALCIVLGIVGLMLLIKGAFPAKADRGFALTNGPVESVAPAAVYVPRRRKGPIVGGLLLLIVGIVVPSFFGWLMATRTNPYRLKPYWWLRMNLESDDLMTASMAFNEMSARYSGKSLSDAQRQALVARGLELQTRQMLLSAWGGWIEQEHAAGRVSATDWMRYLAGGRWSLAVQNDTTLVRGGDGYAAPRITFKLQSSNVGTQVSQRAGFDIPDLQLTIDDRPVTRLPTGLDRGKSSNAPIDFLADPVDLFTPFTDGVHQGRVRGTATIRLPSGGSTTLPVDSTFNISLQRGEWPASAFIHDPAARDAIAGALHARLHAASTPGGNGPIDLDLTVDGASLPYDIGFNVFVVGSFPRPAGIFSCHRGQVLTRLQLKTPASGMLENAMAADVVFLPYPATDASGQVRPIWDGGIRIKDVPIESTPNWRSAKD